MSAKPNNAVLWWAAVGFGFLLVGWTFFFAVAARHRVLEVPLAPQQPNR
jgi:hypothetical protein